MKRREWLRSWPQRLGALVLAKLNGDSYVGPTEASYRPRGMTEAEFQEERRDRERMFKGVEDRFYKVAGDECFRHHD